MVIRNKREWGKCNKLKKREGKRWKRCTEAGNSIAQEAYLRLIIERRGERPLEDISEATFFFPFYLSLSVFKQVQCQRQKRLCRPSFTVEMLLLITVIQV